MTTLNVNDLLKQLINIESTTGNEAKIGTFLSKYLEAAGFAVKQLPIKDNRFNVLAQIGQAKIILQAHIDVVPPFIPASENKTYIYGRGACDTKGSMASMIIAAQQAKARGLKDFGLLFTVGEEVDFAGALAAQSLVKDLQAFLIVGEPTQLKPITSHYGLLVLSLVCSGKAAHSSEPALGENAIDKLISVLNNQVKKLQVYNDTLMSVVQIAGGVADNIIPDKAEALLSLRIAPRDNNDYTKQIQQLVGNQATVQEIQSLPPVASIVPKSLAFLGEGQAVKYCTELTFFKNGLVVGPGNIADAHTANEKVKKEDLRTAVDLYTKVLEKYTA